jgi:hypothetical protein
MHLETFLREAADRTGGAGLPRFVEDEFREFLTCSVLAHGVARLRCEACGLDRLLPFSCKGRGFCPSCGGRARRERERERRWDEPADPPLNVVAYSAPHRGHAL